MFALPRGVVEAGVVLGRVSEAVGSGQKKVDEAVPAAPKAVSANTTRSRRKPANKGSRQKKALPQRPAPPKSEVLRRKKALARRAETRHRPRRKERLAKPRRKRPAGVVDAPLARNGAATWPERLRLATATCAGLTPTPCRVMGGFLVVDKPLRSLTVAAASADTGICSGCPPSERNPPCEAT